MRRMSAQGQSALGNSMTLVLHKIIHFHREQHVKIAFETVKKEISFTVANDFSKMETTVVGQ